MYSNSAMGSEIMLLWEGENEIGRKQPQGEAERKERVKTEGKFHENA